MKMSRKSLSKLDQPKNITNEEKELRENDFIVSKTDTKGKIIYCNEIFVDMAGYPAADLIGANHNLIRHPDMPRVAFKLVWDKIRAKQEFFGFVKNLRANGGFYWVYTYITPDLDEKGNIISYTSVRRKATRSAIETIAPIYKQMVDAERGGGMEASAKILNDLLNKLNMEYDELVINLQKGATL
jgi:PAS domain S-box-containing protein